MRVRLVDYPDEAPFETVLLLDTLKTETPSLSYEEGNRLYQKVLEDYASERSKYKKFLNVKKNPFFNRPAGKVFLRHYLSQIPRRTVGTRIC